MNKSIIHILKMSVSLEVRSSYLVFKNPSVTLYLHILQDIAGHEFSYFWIICDFELWIRLNKSAKTIVSFHTSHILSTIVIRNSPPSQNFEISKGTPWSAAFSHVFFIWKETIEIKNEHFRILSSKSAWNPFEKLFLSNLKRIMSSQMNYWNNFTFIIGSNCKF